MKLSIIFYWFLINVTLSSLGFEEPLQNRICKPDTDLYTYVYDQCNGWSGISIEECKKKCLRNEIPDNCTPSIANPKCQFIQYVQSSQWCHHGEQCTKFEELSGHIIVERKDSTLLITYWYLPLVRGQLVVSIFDHLI